MAGLLWVADVWFWGCEGMNSYRFNVILTLAVKQYVWHLHDDYFNLFCFNK